MYKYFTLIKIENQFSSELAEVQIRTHKKKSIQRNFRTANIFYGEISLRRNIRTAMFLYGEISYGETSPGESSYGKISSHEIM